jgi:hypothetical protein
MHLTVKRTSKLHINNASVIDPLLQCLKETVLLYAVSDILSYHVS